LVQYNYFQNNSGDPGAGNGQGVFFNNSAGTVMTNVIIKENLFNGLETSASVNLANISTASVVDNVLNQDNSIGIFGSNNISITGNITYQATGVTPSFPTNTATAIYISNNGATPNTNITISDNLIYNGSSNGITITGGNDNITVTNNCIFGNTNAGINIQGSTNSNIVINNNNIKSNGTGLLLGAGSYTIPPLLDATNNYWNSTLGPNYNGTGGPGTGETITDNNIPATQSVDFTPFLTSALVCPSPLLITKTTTNTDVQFGSPVDFTVVLTVPAGGVPFELTSFSDPLPTLAGGSVWTITSNPTGIFALDSLVAPQNLVLLVPLPTTIVPGVYPVTLTATTNILDNGDTLTNTITSTIQIAGENGLTQTISPVSVVAIFCYSGESLVHTKNIKTGKIEDIAVKNVFANTHQVYSISQNKFIPIKLNTITGPTNRFRLIKKDAFGENQPNQDFYITSGHTIMYNGIPTKVKHVPMAKRFYTKKDELVYTICTDEHEPIFVNNLPVYTWNYKKWITSSKSNKVFWKNNTRACEIEKIE